MERNVNQTNIFSQSLPSDTLYHYTSQEGVKGIIMSKQIWATNILYLNDSSESYHGIKIIGEILNERQINASTNELPFFEALSTFKGNVLPDDVFVASLTEEGDLLSQWRGYTQVNSGYSIGFDSNQLKRMALDDGPVCHLLKCVYDEDKQKRMINDVIDEGLSSWLKAKGEYQESYTPVAAVKDKLGYLAACAKHPSFSEEKEWRIVVAYPKSQYLKFRFGKSTLIPYLELSWKPVLQVESQLIHSITVGPCPDPKCSKWAINRLLQLSGIQNPRVEESKIPYRSW